MADSPWQKLAANPSLSQCSSGRTDADQGAVRCFESPVVVVVVVVVVDLFWGGVSFVCVFSFSSCLWFRGVFTPLLVLGGSFFFSRQLPRIHACGRSVGPLVGTGWGRYEEKLADLEQERHSIEQEKAEQVGWWRWRGGCVQYHANELGPHLGVHISAAV